MTELGNHDDDYEFCTGHDLPEVTDPYDEDGYCCWCGNGRWKYHRPECKWADARDLLVFQKQ